MSNLNFENAQQLEGKVPFKIAFPLGLQHVLAMFVSNLAPILLIGGAAVRAGHGTFDNDGLTLMIQAAMLMSALTTVVQLYPIKIGSYRIGSGLPIVMGVSFAFVGVGIDAAIEFGMPAVVGAAMIGALLEVVIGFTYRYIKRIFTPLVTGSLLIALGLYLINVGGLYFGGGVPFFGTFPNPNYGTWQTLVTATVTLLVSIGFNVFGKGVWKNASILVGIFVGTVVALAFGITSFSSVGDASWVSVMHVVPFKAINFNFADMFEWGAIIPFLAVYFATSVETIGDTNGVALGGLNRIATEEEIEGGLLADGFGSMLSTIFNAMPNTSFGQNVGIVTNTKVVNKWVVFTGVSFLALLSFLPKLAAIFRIIPDSVLGGALITLFAIILGNGIKMLKKAGFTDKNMLIISIALGLGLGLGGRDAFTSVHPILDVLFGSTVAATAIFAILASWIIKPDYSEGDWHPDHL